MIWRQRLGCRNLEALLICVVSLVAFLGSTIAEVTFQLGQEAPLWSSVPRAWLPPLALALGLAAVHLLLRWRLVKGEQILLPVTGLLLAIGLVILWRLRPAWAAYQQVTRGLIPGFAVMLLLVGLPSLVERLRRDLPVTVSLAGLLLLVATAFAGVTDEAGARLALKLGPLPAIQTTEMIKFSLIVFLAWYMESEGQAAQARVRSWGWLRLPALRYFVPGGLFVAMAMLALVKMSDLGALLVLGFLFVGMLHAGFESRIFATILVIGLTMCLIAGLGLALFWHPPAVIQQRFAAYADPWSDEPLLIDGEPTGITIAQGPGYQLQQAIYAVRDGGISGTGLGMGTPQNVPLAHSDFVFASIAEELGAIGALAVLACFAVLLLRIQRTAIMLPAEQVFERLLLVGIAVHFLVQVFVMVGGTLNLLPMTGVTVPFLSQGGMALLINLAEVGFVLALAQRTERQPA